MEVIQMVAFVVLGIGCGAAIVGTLFALRDRPVRLPTRADYDSRRPQGRHQTSVRPRG